MRYEALRTILIMSISGSALAALLFALKPLLRDRLPKTAQYYMWLVVIAALLTPVSRLAAAPAALTGAPSISKAVERYFVSPGDYKIPESSTADLDALVPDVWVQELADWCSGIYPIGVAAYLVYVFCSVLLFTTKLKLRNAPARAEELAVLTELREDRRAPTLYRNPIASTPMLIGLFKPVIILPDREYGDAQLRAVLLHELTHLRRKDVLVRWLSVLACALHWFNPVVWLTLRELGRACELSCDEVVIRDLDTDGKQSYGDTLLYVAANGKTPRAVLSTMMCEEKRDLKERLGAIMKSRKHTKLATAASVILIAAASLAACALGSGSAETDTDPEKWQELVAQMGGAAQEDSSQTNISAAPSESALPEPVPAADPQEQIIAYLSGLFDEAYTPYYEGLHYAMSGCEEAVTPDGNFTATFLWTMYNKSNGLDVASDFGKEEEGNFYLQATARLGADGLLDLETIEILADNSVRGPSNYVVPIEDFFPPKPQADPPTPSR
jgi:beta-lactamase regulating signal transducer with metallopeptidase domain